MTRGCFTYRTRSTKMAYGKHASTFDIPELWDWLQESNCNVKGALSMAKLCNKIWGDTESWDMFPIIQDISHPKCKKWNCLYFS